GMRATNSAARAARAARSAAAEPVLRRCPGPKAEQLPPRENKRYIHCCDKDGVGEKRQQIYERHRIFLSSAGQYGVHIVMAGPLVRDNGVTPVRSLFVIEAPER